MGSTVKGGGIFGGSFFFIIIIILLLCSCDIFYNRPQELCQNRTRGFDPGFFHGFCPE